jgi:hypothetical protein
MNIRTVLIVVRVLGVILLLVVLSSRSTRKLLARMKNFVKDQGRVIFY